MRIVRLVATVTLIVAALSLAGCPRPVPTPLPPPPDGAASCVTACTRLEQLGCSAARPTPAGGDCVQVCENIELSGVVAYGVECVTQANSCQTADACGGPLRTAP